MGMFDSDNVQVSGGYDRKKLRVGRYLVKLLDSKEVIGGFKGQRYQTVFEVVKGRHAAPGTVKSDILMAQSDPQKAKKDNFKIQKRLAAFRKCKPAAITNEIYEKITRTVKVKSTQEEGEVILKETFPAEKGELFGKLAVLVVKPHINKQKKRTCFYDYEPFDGDDSVFEEFVDEPYEDEDEEGGSSESAPDLSEARKAAAEAEGGDEEAPELPDEEPVDPMTKAAQAGWRIHPKNPSYYFNANDKAAGVKKKAELEALFK